MRVCVCMYICECVHMYVCGGVHVWEHLGDRGSKALNFNRMSSTYDPLAQFLVVTLAKIHEKLFFINETIAL